MITFCSQPFSEDIMDMTKVPQRKRIAMGSGPLPGNFKAGGTIRLSPKVPSRSTGLADSPLETVRRNNGIPGMKKGGKV